MEKPIVGMINGVAAGAGCSVALACDMRIMSSDATLIEEIASATNDHREGLAAFLEKREAAFIGS